MPKDPIIESLPLDALSPVETGTDQANPDPIEVLPLDALSPVDAPLESSQARPAPIEALPLDALNPVESETQPAEKAQSKPDVAPIIAPASNHAPNSAQNDSAVSQNTNATANTSAASIPTNAPPGDDDTILSMIQESLDDKYLNSKLQRHVDPATPAKMRMLAAKNMVPMPPRDQAHVLYQLTLDEHPKIAAAALQSFAKLGGPILEALVGDNSIAPQVLGRLAELAVKDPKLSEKLLLNKTTPDVAFAYMASETASEGIIEIIANNQQRLLRDHDIVRALKKNPSTLRSTFERVVDFMVRNGVLLRDVSEFSDSFSRLNRKDLDEFADKVEVPFALLAPEEREKLRRQGKAPTAAEPELDLQDLPQGDELDELDLDELEMLAATEEEDAEQTQKKQSALQMLRDMTIAQQVKLAMLGSKEVRGILLRSTVRMVAEAAMRSPRITEMEVASVASSRSVQDSVIRIIAKNREWTRLYQIKLALCNNPKTPISVSMGFLRTLRLHDIKSISKSKNIAAALTQQAKRIVKQKSGIKG